jgi:hypothetical protein
VPYPDVSVTEAGVTCGGWTATVDATGTLSLAGPPASGQHSGSGQSASGQHGAAIDGLRALATAAWAARDKHGTLGPAQVAAALDQLAKCGLHIG